MIIDVTTQRNGYDMRARGTPVSLPPDVIEVTYNTPRGAVEIVRGGRDKIAAALRAAGYHVSWIDSNPAVVLGSMTSPAKAAAARRNGARHKGTPRRKATP